MKKLYLFDFDGTLTCKDTMFLYLKFYNPMRYYVQLTKHFPLFVLLKLKLLEADKVKKSFIASILKGEKKEKIQQKSQEFFEQNYPKIFRQNALDFIENMDRENTNALIVSASLDIWVKPFAEYFNIPLLATEAEFSDGIFTGNFATKNCNGIEKVFRIRETIFGKKYDKIIAFGDSSGDKQMMKFANESHYQFFH
jgi:HAD superfamily hydrolase (TIGR01490 family)